MTGMSAKKKFALILCVGTLAGTVLLGLWPGALIGLFVAWAFYSAPGGVC